MTCAEFQQLNESDQVRTIGALLIIQDPQARLTDDSGQPTMAFQAAAKTMRTHCRQPGFDGRLVADLLTAYSVR